MFVGPSTAGEHDRRGPASQRDFGDRRGGSAPFLAPPLTIPPGSSSQSARISSIAPPDHSRTRADALDALFSRLADAGGEDEARAIAHSIGRIWARSGSDTADLLLERAALAAEVGDFRLSLELFDRIIALQPTWPEGFVGRANVKAMAGDHGGAMSDFEAAVKLEPRRFDALGALAALQEGAEAWKAALDSYRRALALDPRREDWRKAEERLRLQVEGRDI